MEKNEGTYRTIAKRIWDEVYSTEHPQGYTGEACFINMVSAGIAAGVRAYCLTMAANQSGNINDIYVVIEEPRIV